MNNLPDEAIDALVRRDIREGRSMTLHVTGLSMKPDLSPGDKLVVSPGRYFPGDAIAFLTHQPGQRKIHRYLGPVWTTKGWKRMAKGDNTPTPDVLVESRDLVGKVRSVNGENYSPTLKIRLLSVLNFVQWVIRISAGKLLP